MTNHSYKGLTQPLQTDTAKPCRRVSGPTTVAIVIAAVAAARTKTSSISVRLFT